MHLAWGSTKGKKRMHTIMWRNERKKITLCISIIPEIVIWTGIRPNDHWAQEEGWGIGEQRQGPFVGKHEYRDMVYFETTQHNTTELNRQRRNVRPLLIRKGRRCCGWLLDQRPLALPCSLSLSAYLSLSFQWTSLPVESRLAHLRSVIVVFYP